MGFINKIPGYRSKTPWKMIIASIFYGFIFLIFVGILGGDSYPSELKQLAQKEKTWLNETLPLLNQVKDSYSQWETGNISREQLAEQLIPIYKELDEVQEQYINFRRSINFSKSDAVKHPDYQEALWYGESIRKNIMTFIAESCLGYPAAKGVFSDAPKQNDEHIRDLYNSLIKFGCTRKLEKLQAKLNELEQKGLIQ